MGEGIGPGPGEDGAVIAPAAFPPTLSRAYRERSDADIKRIRALDAAQLASRGYFPLSEGFVPGQWRPIDWLVAILFGLIWVIFLLVVKPAGTVTVYLRPRSSAASDPVGASRTGVDPDRGAHSVARADCRGQARLTRPIAPGWAHRRRGMEGQASGHHRRDLTGHCRPRPRGLSSVCGRYQA